MPIDFGVNLNPGDINNLTRLNDIFRTMGITMAEVVDVTQSFNNAQRLVREQIVATIKESRTAKEIGQNLVVNFTQTATGARANIRRQITNTANKTRQNRQRYSQIISDTSADTFAALPSGSITEAIRQKVSTMTSQLGNIYNKSSIDFTEFKTLIHEVLTGVTHDFSTLNIEQIKVIKSARGLRNLVTKETGKAATVIDAAKREAESEEVRRKAMELFAKRTSSIPGGAPKKLKRKAYSYAETVSQQYVSGKDSLPDFIKMLSDSFIPTSGSHVSASKGQRKLNILTQDHLLEITNLAEKRQQQQTREKDALALRNRLEREYTAILNSGANPEERAKRLSSMETVINRLVKAFKSGKMSVSDFNTTLAAVMSGAKPAAMTTEMEDLFGKMKYLKTSMEKDTPSMIKSKREIDAMKLRNDLEKEFIKLINTGANPEERAKKILTMERAISQMVKGISTGKIEMKDFESVLKDMLSGVKSTGLSTQLEELYTKMSALKESLGRETPSVKRKRNADIRETRLALASGVRENLETHFTRLIPTGLTPDKYTEQVLKIRTSIESMIKPLINGKMSIKEFTQTFSGFTGGIKILSGVSSEVTKLDIALEKLKRTVSTSPGNSSAANTAKGIIDWIVSPSGLSRLAVLQVAHKAVGALITQIQKYADQTIELERIVTRIKTITPDLKMAPKEWKRELIDISSRTGTDVNQVASAANELYSNTLVKGKEGLPLLEKSLQFSKISGSTPEDAINLLTATLTSFNMSIDEADSVLSTFFKTIDLGKVNVSELSTTIGMVAPLAGQLSVPLEDLSSAFVTLTSHSISTEQAGTLLRNLLKEMISPTKELKELFGEWGAETGEQAIKIHGLGGVLAKFSQELKNKGPERISQLVDDLRSLLAIPALADENNLQRFMDTKKQMRETGAIDKAKANQLIGESTSLGYDKLIANIKNRILQVSDPLFTALNKIFDTEGSKVFGLFLDKIVEAVGRGVELLGNLVPIVDKLGARFVRWTGLKLDTLFAPFKWLEDNATRIEQLLDRLEKWATGNDPQKGRELEVTKAQEKKKELYAEIDELQIKLNKDTQKFTQENGNLLANLKNISGIEKDSVEKFTKAQAEHIEKVRDKSKNVMEDLRNAFSARELTGKTAGDTLFDRIIKAGPVMAELSRDAVHYFNERNLDRAREKFDTIQKIVERINDELKTSISDSLKRIADISAKMDQTSFEQKLRGKSKSVQGKLLTTKINQLIGEAFNTPDINSARELLTEAERLADFLYDKKKKTKGDQLITQVRQAQIQREQLNIQFAQQNMFNENELLSQRLTFENQMLNMEERIVKLSEAEIERNRTKLEIRRKEIDLINEQIKALMKKVRLEEGTIIQNSPFGEVGVGRANGGLGVDNRLTRISSNEMVMNSMATRHWTTTLASMNAGLPIRNSGNVNVGDININYNSSNSTETDVRRLAEGIRREIRRGTVRLT
jgi:TP901 family phage tail tape measure protein